jgi:hypothetical protein
LFYSLGVIATIRVVVVVEATGLIVGVSIRFEVVLGVVVVVAIRVVVAIGVVVMGWWQ